MDIEKAIEILERHYPIIQRLGIPGLYEADKLSIEALKLVQKLQSLPARYPSFRLPSQAERREHE